MLLVERRLAVGFFGMDAVSPNRPAMIDPPMSGNQHPARQLPKIPAFSRNSSETPRHPRSHYLRIGDNTTATRIEMQSINEDKGILDVPFK